MHAYLFVYSAFIDLATFKCTREKRAKTNVFGCMKQEIFINCILNQQDFIKDFIKRFHKDGSISTEVSLKNSSSSFWEIPLKKPSEIMTAFQVEQIQPIDCYLGNET